MTKDKTEKPTSVGNAFTGATNSISWKPNVNSVNAKKAGAKTARKHGSGVALPNSLDQARVTWWTKKP